MGEDRRARLLRRATPVGCLLGVGVSGLIAYLGGVTDPLGLRGGSGHWPNSLAWSLPEPPQNGTFVGFQNDGASALTAAHTGQQFGHITFVPANVASHDYLTVSVNPIDRFTWSAVAESTNGRCYAILVSVDPEDPCQRSGKSGQAR